jgi:hypothetical protein
MAVDAISLSPKLDAVILITGDGDFVPLVEYLKYNRRLPSRMRFVWKINFCKIS